VIIAKYDELDRIITGPEAQSQIDNNGYFVFAQNFTCPICYKQLRHREASVDRPFAYFVHSDGSTDCFKTESTSDEHRLALELTIKALYNRIREVTGEPVEIDAERWIGVREDFVIADVRVTSPLRIAAEVFYKCGDLALGRRFKTMFANGYQTYLIFHTSGKHDPYLVERYIQRVAPLRVGRFDSRTLEISLGDLFSDQQIEMSRSNRDRLPNYIAR